MAYDINWLDHERQIVVVRLFDPFSKEEAQALHDEFQPTLEAGQPIYVLIDIREFNAMKALATLGGPDGMPLPRFDPEQARRSRLALLGGSKMVDLLLKMTDDTSDQIRVFRHEDEAHTWLQEQARGSTGDGAGFDG